MSKKFAEGGIVKPMTQEELEEWKFNEARFCGCGDIAQAEETLRELLEILNGPLNTNEPSKSQKLDGLIPNFGTQQLILYYLELTGLTEHNYIITSSRLTGKGKDVLAVLNEQEEKE